MGGQASYFHAPGSAVADVPAEPSTLHRAAGPCFKAAGEHCWPSCIKKPNQCVQKAVHQLAINMDDDKTQARESDEQLAAVSAKLANLQAQAAQDAAAAETARQALLAKATAELQECKQESESMLRDVQEQARCERASLRDQHNAEQAALQERSQSDRHRLLQQQVQKAKVCKAWWF